MFDTPTRRANRDVEASARLSRLITRARAEPPAPSGDLPADQDWVDLSGPPESAAPPTPSAGRHRGDPWWRRGRPGRLVERWIPGGTDPPARRRRVPIVLVVGLALGVAVAAGIVLSSGSAAREATPALPAASATAEPTAGPAAGPGAGGSIVVSVVGLVVRPGLVTLPDGARVADAVRAAGGPAPGVDLGGLNLARRLADGEQVSVGVPDRPDPPPGGSSGAGDKVDLNSASAAQLDTLPGVGQVTTQRIIDWRTKHGPFTRVEQLREVDGIGPARFARLKELVVVR